MSENTVPVFIIGTGRNGTRSMFKMLSGVDDVDVYHEFVCTHIQKLAALYYMGVIDKDETKRQIMELHGSAIVYSDAKLWIDSSNKLTWLVEPLAELFPEARFLLMVRDGRKVSGSFYYKLSEEIYDDRSTGILTRWLSSRTATPVPPPEKKYWWNIPQLGQPFHVEFPTFDQFQRICYHWQECNRFALHVLEKIPAAQRMIIKLEDVVANVDILKSTLAFIGTEYDDNYPTFLETPQNVFFPMDFKLTSEQLEQFDAICAPMMKTLGYEGKPVYDVKY